MVAAPRLSPLEGGSTAARVRAVHSLTGAGVRLASAAPSPDRAGPDRPGLDRPGLDRPGLDRPGPGAPSVDRAPEGLPRGRLIELMGDATGARRSVAVEVALASQREGDPVAWIQPEGGGLYPPDVAAAGVDLDGLLVVHVPASAGVVGLPKAAELTLRTGAFGAVIVDVEGVRLPRGAAWLSRLAALAREHDTRCLFLAAPSDRSLGPMVAVRLCPRRRQTRPGRYLLEAEILRDKSGWRPRLPGPRVWAGPAGMP